MYFLGILVYLIYFIAASQAKSEYIIDVLEVEWNVTTKNNCDMSWKLSQPTRGAFALSGFFDIKEDINTNNAKGWVDVYYSKNGITYTLTPYRLPPTVLTDALNFLYKNYMMDTALECCENAIDIKGIFASPLTKRRMICENCLLKTNNSPTHMREGYYRLVGICVGEIEYMLATIVKLETE